MYMKLHYKQRIHWGLFRTSHRKIDQLTWHNQLLILTDVKGGTPSNVALRLSKIMTS